MDFVAQSPLDGQPVAKVCGRKTKPTIPEEHCEEMLSDAEVNTDPGVLAAEYFLSEDDEERILAELAGGYTFPPDPLIEDLD